MTTLVSDRYVEATTLSEGWLGAMAALYRIKGATTVHLLVRIADPTTEIPEIRKAAENLLDAENKGVDEKRQKPAIETTRNTIFPASWARRMPEPEMLASHYADRYHKNDGLRSVYANGRGTYFGRIVAYPRFGDQKPGDQLSETVRKLRAELQSNGGAKSSRYEINIYNESCDRNPTSFPCLAHLSVHLHERKLHMQAIYRNEYLVGRGYGNFLGLAELQAYMAAAANVEVGELLLTIGHGKMDAKKTATKNLLGGLWAKMDEGRTEDRPA
jgi:thymidylate synthase